MRMLGFWAAVTVAAVATGILSMDFPARLAPTWSDAALAAGTGPAASPIAWGVNGHPLVAYRTLPAAAQLELVRDLGLRSYRVDVYGMEQIEQLAALVDAARARGVAILPVLIPDPMKARSEEDAYASGFDLARAFAARFRGRISAWELGNEYDNAVGMTGDGSDPAQFEDARYKKARGAIRGMLDGARAGDPAALRIVDNAGWCHYGFLHRLARDGVEWDVTGQHWYSDQGDMERAACGCGAMRLLGTCRTNILAILAEFRRPIWITEFNDNAAARRGADRASADWIVAQMAAWTAAAQRYGIRAAHIYELLDEPELPGKEASFGLARADGSPKPAYAAVKAFVAGAGGR